MKSYTYAKAGETPKLLFPPLFPRFSPVSHCEGESGGNGGNIFIVSPVPPPPAALAAGGAK
jgi:hypothetical protein